MMEDDTNRPAPPVYPWAPASPSRARRLFRVQDAMFHPIVWILIAVAIGAFLGTQAVGTAQRYTKLLVALVFVFAIFRFPSFVGVGIFLLLYPFPARIQIGSTNMIFIVLLAVAWMIRMGLNKEPRIQRTDLDWPIFAYLAVHILSLINVESMPLLVNSLNSLLALAVPILFYYIVVHVTDDERKFFFLIRMFTISVTVLYLMAFLERFAPHVQLLPRWYVSVLGAWDPDPDSVQRVGGMISNVMMSDMAAIFVILQLFLMFRSRSGWRWVHGGLAVVSIYVLSITGNRGGPIALLVGGLYFLWIFRREVTVKRMLAAAAMFVGVALIAEQSLGRIEGNITLFNRFSDTYFERGLPDTRRVTWMYAWNMIKENPLLGHGPYFSHQEIYPGLKPVWPHNGFLFYLFTIGFIGLPTFLFLLGQVLRRTWAGHGLRVREISLARGMMAVMHIATVQFIIGQMRSDHQRGDVYIYLMWILFAFGILARRLYDRERRAPAPSPPPVLTGAIARPGG